ncbi:hypothetical protein scyTo_0014556 [Scyliorhinus torazame]|uniref:Uncharacterized protein n=1 Tax=Scyliorhinus torazame TaxID=75743 RepID=A0A401NPU2_SCYTO|nr:hypothetical protein [Scyliorhinus torazame]
MDASGSRCAQTSRGASGCRSRAGLRDRPIINPHSSQQLNFEHLAFGGDEPWELKEEERVKSVISQIRFTGTFSARLCSHLPFTQTLEFGCPAGYV